MIEEKTSALSVQEETTRLRFERQRKGLVSRIQDIDRVLALLEKNPELEELQDLLRRI